MNPEEDSTKKEDKIIEITIEVTENILVINTEEEKITEDKEDNSEKTKEITEEDTMITETTTETTITTENLLNNKNECDQIITYQNIQ